METQPKPGIRTTEFWRTTIIDIVAIVMMLLTNTGQIDPTIAPDLRGSVVDVINVVCALLLALNTASYNIGRAITKRK